MLKCVAMGRTVGPLTEADAKHALEALVAKHGTQQVAAKVLRVSPQYINDLLRGRREFSSSMLEKLGMRRVVVKR